MVMIKHELKQGWITLLIWTMVITFMLSLCIFIYPEMETQMADFNSMFAEMGSFSAAFGMDRINFGEFIGFFGVECGNVLGLGGAFFAALLGAVILKETFASTFAIGLALISLDVVLSTWETKKLAEAKEQK